MEHSLTKKAADTWAKGEDKQANKIIGNDKFSAFMQDAEEVPGVVGPESHGFGYRWRGALSSEPGLE